jgi:DNA-binding PadR family transcriptional regulator
VCFVCNFGVSLNIGVDIAFDIKSDIDNDITGDIMRDEEKEHIHNLRDELRAERHMCHRRDWLRHNAMVPKGFLRYHVLSALNDKPMSGSELMEEISKKTYGNWKPSPGSIYPMLSYLQDNQYIKELPTENGLKRYELTQTGKELLEEETKARDKFREDAGFMAFSFFDRSQSKIPNEKAMQVRHTLKRVMAATIMTGKTLKEKYSEPDFEEVLKILNEAAEKLETINKKLQSEKQ